MIRFCCLILTAVLVTGIAYSKEKPNTKTAEPQKAAEPEQRGSDKNPITVKVLPTPDAETKAAQEEKQRHEKAVEDKRLADATVWLAIVTTALAIFTALLWLATYRLAKDARNTANRQARETQDSLRIAKQSADAALKTAQNMEAAERAYIKMSHTEHGLYQDQPNMFALHLRVRNFGQTPATVTDLVLAKHLLIENQRLPASPDYSQRAEGEPPNYFLVRDDEFFTPIYFPIAEQELSAINTGTHILYVIGYVDYVDKFGHRHRAGYARRYKPIRGSSDNLKIVIQTGYNYDRQRKPGEGNDWNEPV